MHRNRVRLATAGATAILLAALAIARAPGPAIAHAPGLAIARAPAGASASGASNRPAPSAADPSGGCSWAVEVGAHQANAYFPDTHATYWATAYDPVQGSGLVIRGRFPNARYFSYTAYVGAGSADAKTAQLYDARIDPAGGVNRFRRGNRGGGSYVLHVLALPRPSAPAPNTLYVGSAPATTPAAVVLVYRVYAPTRQRDATGGAGLPAITTTVDGAPTSRGRACTGSSSGSAGRPPSQKPVHPTSGPPRWYDTTGSVGYYPNLQNGYLFSLVTRKPGRIVVVRSLMPSFPDTNDDRPVWLRRQVRYWSLCENQASGRKVVACDPDYRTRLDAGGYATFVISTRGDRPADAPAADPINWLPWGPARVATIMYRQMLAAPAFAQSIEHATGSGRISATMGRYYPQIAYCSTTEFRRHGAAGCLAAARDQGGRRGA